MRSRGSQQNTGNEDILSEEDQQKVISELKEEASSQADYFRKVFFAIFITVSAVFLICLGYSFYWPWGLMHQQHFKDKVSHNAFLLYYALSAYCFLVAGLLVKVGS